MRLGNPASFLAALVCLALSSEAVAQVTFNPASGSTVNTGDNITVTNNSGSAGVARWYDMNDNPVSDPVAVPSGGGGTNVPAPPVAGEYKLKVTVIKGAGGDATYKVN
jgi:hypothetical protein